MTKIIDVANNFRLKLANEPIVMLKGDIVFLPHYSDDPYIGVLTGQIRQRKKSILQVIFPDRISWIPNDQMTKHDGNSWSHAIQEVINSGNIKRHTIDPGHHAVTGANKTVEWKEDGGIVIELTVHDKAIYY